MASIRFDRVTKQFDGNIAVNELTLEALDGEFLVLLGPSGCGKSTILRMLAGLEKPSSGAVIINGEDVTELDARKRDVAMVFQSYALYPHMSVQDNIESPLLGRHRNLNKSIREEQVRNAAELLGLETLLKRKPRELSGGERQRVALARAIVRNPSVFLMDEPLSNLDSKLRAKTRVELTELHERLETTFVYVTHDQIEAMTMASRIAVLRNGVLQQVAEPKAIYNEPENVFVAQFIGSPPMNVLAGCVARSGEGAARIDFGEKIVDIGEGWPSLRHEQKVHLGFRPEHVVVSDVGWETDVLSVEWLGSEQVTHVTFAGQRILIRSDGGSASQRPGSSIRIEVEPSCLHIFDRLSGSRISRFGTS